ncbi:putative ferric-chelate reductase 1 isoform X2 [Nerophis lumbriciformis]|uniref:putative ferric-chelate reductase 1 isoform X2 n=1 Tax=Nerophis lumbriciformis TaxID=546530 RepID=UPI002AE008A2|nr:putative ferric-chelate reductase 1 isoform X2 [Nerophis lumbriciformis]
MGCVLLLLLLLLGCLAPVVWTYSSGQVADSCEDLHPRHSGLNPQRDAAPFIVTADPFREEVTVQLTAPDSKPFLGFLLQARALGQSSPVGSFSLLTDQARLLNCSQKPNSAVSHTSKSPKTSIKVIWTQEPSGKEKQIQFHASFVQDYQTFWVDITSPTLTLSEESSMAAGTNLTPLLQSATTSSISSEGCGVTKVCFQHPPNCQPEVSADCYFLSAIKVTPTDRAVRFEVTGRSDGYISFGFSHDQTMGGDDIYVCGKASDGLLTLQRYFSSGRQRPQLLPLGNVSQHRLLMQEGSITCSFTSFNTIHDDTTSNTIHDDTTSNTIHDDSTSNTIHDDTTSNTIHDDTTSNTIHDDTTSNTIHDDTTSNTIHDDTTSNTIHDDSTSNTIHDDTTSNTIHDDTTSNTIHDDTTSNTIHDDTTSNTIHDDTTSNTIHDDSTSNTIHDDTTSNTIHDDTTSNTIHDDTTSNTIHDDTTSNTIHDDSTSNTISSFYLMLASGPVNNGLIQLHTQTFISSHKVNIFTPQLVSTSGISPVIKAHGALMLVGWMTTGSQGMLVARYLKGVSRGHKVFGKDVWFLVHVTLMSVTLAATGTAFILSFSYAKNWSGGVHPVLGCMVTTLCVVQVLPALLRCQVQHPLRVVFNCFHASTAALIKVLAVAAIFTGLKLIDSSASQWLMKVMGGLMGWEVVFHTLMQVNTSCRLHPTGKYRLPV